MANGGDFRIQQAVIRGGQRGGEGGDPPPSPFCSTASVHACVAPGWLFPPFFMGFGTIFPPPNILLSTQAHIWLVFVMYPRKKNEDKRT